MPTSAEILKIEKEEQAAAAKSDQGRIECQGEWTALTSKFIATQPEVTDKSEGAGALCACSRFSTENQSSAQH